MKFLLIVTLISSFASAASRVLLKVRPGTQSVEVLDGHFNYVLRVSAHPSVTSINPDRVSIAPGADECDVTLVLGDGLYRVTLGEFAIKRVPTSYLLSVQNGRASATLDGRGTFEISGELTCARCLAE